MLPATEFDPEAIVRLRRIGNAAFVREMLDLFEQLAVAKLDAARLALTAGDLAALAAAAHPLKSSSGGVGARCMYDLATRIELHATRGETEPLAVLVAELEAAFVRFRPELQSARERIAP